MGINIYLLIISIIFGYLIGSISFANIIAKKIKGIDIKEIGSGNAGTTNVLRSLGFFPGLLTFILDFLKGSLGVLVPLLFAKLFKENSAAMYMSLGGIFAIIGHIFPIFFGFKGGKGVATFLGMILAINPFVFFINATFMIIIIVVTKMVSIASIASGMLLPILILFLKNKSILPEENIYFFIASLIIAIAIIIMHRGNIKRIKEGTENKISFKKEK